MAADLHIHVFEGVVEEDLSNFFSNSLGSKYFKPKLSNYEQTMEEFSKISKTPSIWVGAVSWLKAGLLEGGEALFVPATVNQVAELIGEDLPVLDEELKEKILAAFDLPNNTSYSLAKKESVEEFLNTHIGKRLFTVSW